MASSKVEWICLEFGSSFDFLTQSVHSSIAWVLNLFSFIQIYTFSIVWEEDHSVIPFPFSLSLSLNISSSGTKFTNYSNLTATLVFNSVLRKIQNWKAAGLDEIPPEVWKTREFDDILLRHCNAIDNPNTIDRWKKGCIFSFPEKGDFG